REIAQNLKQVILHNVANCAGGVVEGAAALNTEILGHGDLDALDVVAIPEGLHEGVCEAEHEEVVHRALAEVMVDTKYVYFVEGFVENLIQFASGFEVAAKGLFDDDAGAVGRP